jgi:hypothetical protein
MWWRRLRVLKRGQALPPHQFHLLIPSRLLKIAYGVGDCPTRTKNVFLK